MKRYAEYKDSGIEWIGEIPKDWEVKRLKWIGKAKNGLTYKPKDVCENGTLVLRATNIQNNKILLEDNLYVSCEIPKEIILRKNDLLICSANGSRDLVGKSAIIDQSVIGETYGSFMLVFRSKYNNFIEYILSSNALDFYKSLFVTTTINQLTKQHLYNIIVPFPKFEEQEEIVSYLNYKTTAIDNLIINKQKLIVLLKEYRQAIICEAVTKGLNKNLKMKDSGIEWIGEIPEHWKTTPFGFLFSFSRGLNITKANLEEEGIPCVTYGNIHSNCNFDVNSQKYTLKCVSENYIKCSQEALLKYGDFVFADTSEDIEGSGNFTYLSNDEVIFAGYHTIIAKNKNSHNPRYLAYLFDSIPWRTQIRSKVTGTKVFSITQNILKETTVLLPSKLEQEKIVRFLDSKIFLIDFLIVNITAQIEKFKEYRKTTIREAVTGKIMIVTERANNEKNMYFKHSILGAHILNKLCDEPTMGHVKFEKLFFLSEYNAELGLNTQYARCAAGPYNRSVLISIDKQLKEATWFEYNKNLNTYNKYKRLQKSNDYKIHYEQYFNYKQKLIIDKLLDLFKKFDSEQCEIIATLYAAWNDFLIEGIQPTEKQIINEVLTNWHKDKEKIYKYKWSISLKWMKENKIIPIGYGLSTKEGGLFNAH